MLFQKSQNGSTREALIFVLPQPRRASRETSLAVFWGFLQGLCQGERHAFARGRRGREMPAERHVRIELQRCLLHGPVQIRDQGEAAIAHFCVLDAQMPRAQIVVGPSSV